MLKLEHMNHNAQDAKKGYLDNKIKEIIQAYHKVKDETDLSPNNPKINNALSFLVGTAMEINSNLDDAKAIMSDAYIKSIRNSIKNLAQNAEYQMENFWNDYFLKQKNTPDLTDFIYHAQYDHITDKEHALFDCEVGNLLSCGQNKLKPRVAFAGSGPLPLTAILLSQKHGIMIDLIDCCPNAVKKSTDLIEKLGIPVKAINVCAQDADYSKYDIVFIASMIDCKKDVMNKLVKDNVPYISVRGADGLSQLFYDDINPDDYAPYKLMSYAPSDEMSVNSSYLLHKE